MEPHDAIVILLCHPKHILCMECEKSLNEKICPLCRAPYSDPNMICGYAYDFEEKGKIDEAVKWYRIAAEKGNKTAMNNLGMLLEDKMNLKEAEKWYRLAIEKGNVAAMNNLGSLLNRQNKIEEAEKWYRMAIEKGSIKAMNNLGMLLEDKMNLKEAEKWYRMAIEKGNTKAIDNISILHYNRGYNEKRCVIL